jgi:hypothetical protein
LLIYRMSSLRLALKQSLQETGHLAPKEKKKKSSKAPRQRGRPRQPGDPPRKRGRPPKHPRPTSESSVPASDNANNDEDKRREEDEEEYSSENEFSYDSEMSHEDDDEEEEEVDDEGDDQEEEEHDEANDDQEGQGEGHHEGDHGEQNQNQNGEAHDSKKLEKARIRNEDTIDSDEERRKKRKLLKKQLKHSAANKIQSQWKKNKIKSKASESDGSMRTMREKHVSTSDPNTDSTSAENVVEKNGPMEENPTANAEHKKKRKSGTVPAPVLEVLEWSRSVSEKKCRKHIAKGMRVKVCFL